MCAFDCIYVACGYNRRQEEGEGKKTHDESSVLSSGFSITEQFSCLSFSLYFSVLFFQLTPKTFLYFAIATKLNLMRTPSLLSDGKICRHWQQLTMLRNIRRWNIMIYSISKTKKKTKKIGNKKTE